MSVCKKVQDWDDSAGLEAFQNAKFCEWAKINNRQCNIPLPDPDMYIDNVNYDTFIDPELVADLHSSEPEQPAPVGSSVSYMNESIRATEWVDTQVPVPASGLTAQNLSANSDLLLIGHHTIKPTGWDVAENSYGWNDGMHKTSGHHENTNDEAGGNYGRNKDGAGCFDSRKTTSRFKTDHYPSNSGWKNCRGKQSKMRSLQWRPKKTSVPGNNQAPNDSGATLQCEKSVSQ